MSDYEVGTKFQISFPDESNSWETGTIVTLTAIYKHTDTYAQFTSDGGHIEDVYWWEVEPLADSSSSKNILELSEKELVTITDWFNGYCFHNYGVDAAKINAKLPDNQRDLIKKLLDVKGVI